MDIPDEILVRNYLGGDDFALEALASRYLPILVAYVSRFVPDAQAAEDIAQEALFKAWKAFSQFDPSLPFRPWMFRIAKNTALDWMKKRKEVSFSSLTEFAPEDSLQDTALTPAERAMSMERQRAMAAALDSLPEPYRAVLFMRYYQDFSFQAMAAELGKPLNTIRSQHRRGLNLLRQLFSGSDLGYSG